MTTRRAVSSSGALKRVNAPPLPLHDGVSVEGRWRVFQLLFDVLQSVAPPAAPAGGGVSASLVIELEKRLFAQSGGDWSLYEPAVYHLCACVKYKALSDLMPMTILQAMHQPSDAQGNAVKSSNKGTAAAAAAAPSSSSLAAAVECQIKCGRCKSTHVSVEQKQTRGADESMTVFVQCENCGLRWKM